MVWLDRTTDALRLRIVRPARLGNDSGVLPGPVPVVFSAANRKRQK